MFHKFNILTCLSCVFAVYTVHAQDADFTVTELERYEVPWALEFLPDGRLLISEMAGALKLRSADGAIGEITGLPEISHGGQGGFGDVVLHPDFEENNLVYMSYVEPGDGEIWSMGHRNPLGLAFDESGQLWNIEMGPRHGDELNMVERAKNYGYPIVSNGDHYETQSIPDHPLSSRTAVAIRDYGLEISDHGLNPEFDMPSAYWVPAISPSSLMFYSGSEFPEWNGDAFIGGLSGQAVIRVEFDGAAAQEAQRLEVDGRRIRDVEQGPDGAIWVLEDGRRGDGYLFKLTAP